MRLSFINSQKGFSAVGLFFILLALMLVMNLTGTFKPLLSEVDDKNFYSATGSKNINGKGLLITDLNFQTPTPEPTPTTGPQPTIVIPPKPTLDPDMCLGYSKIDNCKCVAPYHKSVYCEGRTPPGAPDCTGDLASCTDTILGKANCLEYCAAKPVIYLYPTVPTYVDIAIITPGTFVESIPQLESGLVLPMQNVGGWKNVLALPSGVLQYQKNYYRELFYDTSLDFVKAPLHGVFIETSDLKTELDKYISELGLLDDEKKEFLDYWIPKLTELNKKYIFFSVIDNYEKQRVDKVLISPKPDTFIEFMAYFNGVNEKYDTRPLLLPTTPQRVGFTAVEWGGVIEPSSFERIKN